MFVLQRKVFTGETETKSFRMMHAKNVSRPQMKFKDKVDNSNTPFVPIIKYKPNALKPLNLGKYIGAKVKQSQRERAFVFVFVLFFDMFVCIDVHMPSEAQLILGGNN